MKVTFALLSAAVVVAAHSHNHMHLHRAKRQAPSDIVVVPETINYFILNGEPISEAEVEEGIRNGTLQLLDGEGPLSQASVPLSTIIAPPSSTAPASTSSAAASPSPPPAAPPPAAAASSDPAANVNTPFPSGQIGCDTFPSAFGAVPVEWLGLGGWTGVQQPGAGGGGIGFSNILTVDNSVCNGVNCCVEGSYCSYACPPGYQKAQWPQTQGATGQSVGGLLCQGGKLQLTNPGLSSNLCIPGTSNVQVSVQNQLGSNVAVCRTDYPGTESETIPVNVEPGCSEPLACPDASQYYEWRGAHTSAQYYVNPAGVSVQDACQWGSAGNPWGNFAPLNLGVGWSNGNAYIGIFQNSPTTNAKLQFDVSVVGDNVVGGCNYTASLGQYCDNNGCNSQGCTAAASSGNVKIVFS